MNTSLKLFVSYATSDEAFRQELEQSLAGMRRTGILETWTFRRITPGENLDQGINDALEAADIIALLVSPAFLDSDYCWNVEMKRAVELQDSGRTVLLPIIIRSCVWEDAPFARLAALPEDAKPVAEWASRDAAWSSVARGVRDVAEKVRRGSVSNPRIMRLPSVYAHEGLERDANGFLTVNAVQFMALSRVQGQHKIVDEPILLLENRFQRTWLVFTTRVVVCILDDITKNELYDPWRWDCRHASALPVIVESYKEKVGLIHLGPSHRDWLYSVRLHPDPVRLRRRVEQALT